MGKGSKKRNYPGHLSCFRGDMLDHQAIFLEGSRLRIPGIVFEAKVCLKNKYWGTVKGAKRPTRATIDVAPFG